MLLVIHIVVALASVGVATYTFFRPSTDLLNISYASMVMTIASGAALIFSNSAQLMHVCLAGLVYAAATMSLLVFANFRLARQEN